jgi:hypothetical protein
MRTGGSEATADGLRERETSRIGGRRKRCRGGDGQGWPDAYKWAPPGVAVAGQPPSAHAREGSGGRAVEGRLGRARVGEGRKRLGRANRLKTGGGPRGGERREGGKPWLGRARVGRVQRGVWLGHKERGRDFPFFSFLFSTKFHPKILFAKSLNHKQIEHGLA